jgi:hypothetical protein
MLVWKAQQHKNVISTDSAIYIQGNVNQNHDEVIFLSDRLIMKYTQPELGL